MAHAARRLKQRVEKSVVVAGGADVGGGGCVTDATAAAAAAAAAERAASEDGTRAGGRGLARRLVGLVGVGRVAWCLGVQWRT